MEGELTVSSGEILDAFEAHFEGAADEPIVEPDAVEGDLDTDVADEPLEGEGEPDVEGDEPDVDDPELQDGGDPDEELIEIEIGDEVYDVNLEELKSGYLRQEEFVKRQTDLEENYLAKFEEVDAERVKLLDEIEQYAVVAIAGANQYKNINWGLLKQQDPVKYQALRLEALEAQEQADHVQKRRNDIKAIKEQREAILHKAKVEHQTQLAKKLIPEMEEDGWAAKMVKYGETVGYTPEDIGNIADARQLAVLNAARLWSESQVRRKAAAAKKDPVEVPEAIRPAARKTGTPEQSKRVKAALSYLKKDQSVDAAANYFLASGTF